jgi:hypothetical protein
MKRLLLLLAFGLFAFAHAQDWQTNNAVARILQGTIGDLFAQQAQLSSAYLPGTGVVIVGEADTLTYEAFEAAPEAIEDLLSIMAGLFNLQEGEVIAISIELYGREPEPRGSWRQQFIIQLVPGQEPGIWLVDVVP